MDFHALDYLDKNDLLVVDMFCFNTIKKAPENNLQGLINIVF